MSKTALRLIRILLQCRLSRWLCLANQAISRSLYDTQPSCLGGLSNEFIHSPRIDNQMTWYGSIHDQRSIQLALILVSSNSFSSIEGLIRAVESEDSPNAIVSETNIRCVMLFDDEEVRTPTAKLLQADLAQRAYKSWDQTD